MGSIEGFPVATTTRMRRRIHDFGILPTHDQPPHPAGLKFTKRRKLRGLTKGRRV